MIASENHTPNRGSTPASQSKRTRQYHIVKQQNFFEQAQIDTHSPPTNNIFRDNFALRSRNPIEKSVMRPVGGIELFKKMEKGIKDHANDHRRNSKRLNNCTQRSINHLGSSQTLNRFRKDKNELDQKMHAQNSPMKTIDQNMAEGKHMLPFKEETFKKQMSYNLSDKNLKPENSKSGLSSHTGKTEVLRPSSCITRSRKQNFISSTDKWAADQRKSYHDKMALINEINYNKPLEVRYGDRYFEYLLRNRFEDDLGPSPFVYQINGQFSRTRTIQKIKKHGPQLKQKEPLVVKGRSLKNGVH